MNKNKTYSKVVAYSRTCSTDYWATMGPYKKVEVSTKFDLFLNTKKEFLSKLLCLSRLLFPVDGQ